MSRFIQEEDRGQGTLLPERLDDYINEENPVRIVDAFVEGLDLSGLGFDGVTPAKTGRASGARRSNTRSARSSYGWDQPTS